MTTTKMNPGIQDRRRFIEKSVRIAALTGMAGIFILPGCKGKEEEGEGQKVSPPEDLMQEHGLLNRILLIYDDCRRHLSEKESFPMEALNKAAAIVRTFVEDYHEKQEEDYLFPRFIKAHKLTDLVDVLQRQHNAGRAITSRILQLSATAGLTAEEKQQIVGLLDAFNTMYRPHEAREDTVLFPCLPQDRFHT